MVYLHIESPIKLYSSKTIPLNNNAFHKILTITTLKSPSPATTDKENKDTFKKHWKGDCSYPLYIPEIVQNQTWFPRYLHHLERVNTSAEYKCFR